jgi:electron transfer flavoprotein alpha subunit
VELLSTEPIQTRGEDLENAPVVVSGGQGMGSAAGFRLLHRLAELLGGQVGGTRPAMVQGWIPEERMIGQTGQTISPKVLITCGTSGALQYTASLQRAEFIIAINKDPHASILKMADLGIVGDAREIVPRLIRALEQTQCRPEVSYG